MDYMSKKGSEIGQDILIFDFLKNGKTLFDNIEENSNKTFS